jgi:hypothetical protein
MVAMPVLRPLRIGTYNNGQPYMLARGRFAPRAKIGDRLSPASPVLDLSNERPTASVFVRAIIRELKIRFD